MNPAQAPLSTFLEERLICPQDSKKLMSKPAGLVCGQGHEYAVIEGVPILLRQDCEHTLGVARQSLDAAMRLKRGLPPDDALFISTLGISENEMAGVRRQAEAGKKKIDPVARFLVAATNGILYKHLVGSMETYPIPELRLPRSQGARFLDIGCNWGRWCVAAARRGYRPVGVDPSLGAVLAARRICQSLSIQADFVVADARFLPFADNTFETVFSYSVIQHFSKIDARLALSEIGRVLGRDGHVLIQMANKWGLRCLFHQARRGFRRAEGFEVRYWSLPELREMLSNTIGPPKFSADCFFGIGLQALDIDLMPWKFRILIKASEFLRRLSVRFESLTSVADSVYVQATPKAKAA